MLNVKVHNLPEGDSLRASVRAALRNLLAAVAHVDQTDDIGQAVMRRSSVSIVSTQEPGDHEAIAIEIDSYAMNPLSVTLATGTRKALRLMARTVAEHFRYGRVVTVVLRAGESSMVESFDPAVQSLIDARIRKEEEAFRRK